MDPVYIMAVLALAVLVAVRRRALFDIHWRPTGSTWAAIAAAFAIFGLSLVLTQPWLGRMAKQLFLHGGLYVLLGVWFPLYWTRRIERRGLDTLGFHRRNLPVSLVVNLALGLFLGTVMAVSADWSAIAPATFFAALFVLLTGNFFELIFYYGFVHLRLRAAFGPLPAIFGTSFLYVLWHTGTELMLVDHPLAAAGFLFVVGILFQSVFAMTYNLAIIFPFFVGAGVMLDFTVNISALEQVAHYAAWSALAWVLFALGFVLWGRRA